MKSFHRRSHRPAAPVSPNPPDQPKRDAALQRADVLLVEQGLASSRQQARQLILAGRVLDADDRPVGKVAQLFPAGTHLQLHPAANPAHASQDHA